jgi:hypothetical protein
MDSFSWNLIFEYFSKICSENSRVVKIWQEEGVLYVKTNTHFWSHIFQFLLEREIFQTKVVEKIKTQILGSNIFFFENRALYEIKSKNIVQPDKSQMAIWCIRIACRITKVTNTHMEYVILIDFPLQQWLHKHPSILRYTHITCLIVYYQYLSEIS